MKASLLLFVAVCLPWCAAAQAAAAEKIRILLDTDANNELDDQHAIAYMLFNGDKFDVEGITVNATSGGGEIEFADREEIGAILNRTEQNDFLLRDIIHEVVQSKLFRYQ